jgi:hypothetical protein
VHPVNEDALAEAGARSFSKGLPHDELGEPLADCFLKFAGALREGTIEAMECVPLGGSLRLSNPLAESAFDLEGLDSRQFTLAAPPAFASLEQAGEMAELYWQSLARDVPFARWPHDAIIGSALDDINRNHFVASNHASPISTQDLFRLSAAGVPEGPYVSQFLLLPVPYGALTMEQRYLSTLPGQGFAANLADWLALQRGALADTQIQLGDQPRYISTPRGLGEFVHHDYPFQDLSCRLWTQRLLFQPIHAAPTRIFSPRCLPR